MKTSQSIPIVLLILLIFGLVLNGITEDSLWMDEGYSAWLVHDESPIPDSPRELLRYVRDSLATSFERLRLDVHPPLYYLLLDAWTLLVGNSVFALRLLSALMGLLALAATYRFGATAFNQRAGLMALLLLGTSGFFIYYSREARSYDLYLALAMLSSLAYWRFWQKANVVRTLVYAFLGIAILYTHYTALAVIAAHGLYSLFAFNPRKLLKSFVPFTLMGLGFGAWWFLFGAEQFRINTSIEAAGALPSDWGTVAALWLLLTSGIWGYFALILFFSRLNPLTWLLGEMGRDKLGSIAFLLLLGFVPLLFLFGANAAGLALLQLRYLIIIVPAWALLVAYALSELWLPFLKNKQISLILSILILVALSYHQSASFREFWPAKPRWSEASALASSARQPLEPALVYLDERSPFAYYALQDGLLNGLSVRISWREFPPAEIAEIGTDFAESETAWAFVAMQAPASWDAVAALSTNRGVSYRDSVQSTIYYRFEKSSTERLNFQFGTALAYQNPFYQHFNTAVGERLCVPIALTALETIPDNYSVGLHLSRGYNEVVAQVDAGLGALSQGAEFERELCLTIPEAGSFHLRLVVYEWRDALRRLPVLEHNLLWGDYLMLGMLEASWWTPR